MSKELGAISIVIIIALGVVALISAYFGYKLGGGQLYVVALALLLGFSFGALFIYLGGILRRSRTGNKDTEN